MHCAANGQRTALNITHLFAIIQEELGHREWTATDISHLLTLGTKNTQNIKIRKIRVCIYIHAQHSLEVEMYRFDVELLWHHHPPHDGIDEQREENVAEKHQHPHQSPDEHLLRGVHCCLVASPQRT